MPQEVRRYVNCGDAGIYSYLLALQLGLDAGLYCFEGYQGTSQSHLITVVRGSRRDYKIDLDTCEPFDVDGVSASGHYLLDVPHVLKQKREYSVREFLAGGQSLSNYLIGSSDDPYVALIAKVRRAFKIDDEGLFLRKTYELPGVCLSLEFLPSGEGNFCFSRGWNNIKLIGRYVIARFDQEGGALVDCSDDLAQTPKRKIERAILRSWQLHNQVYNYLKRNGFARNRLDVITPSIGLSGDQACLRMMYEMMRFCLDNYRKELGINYRLNWKKWIEDVPLFDRAGSVIQELWNADEVDTFGICQRGLVEKLRSILAEA